MIQQEKYWLSILQPFKNKTLIIGCSGGIDSMVLLHFLISHQFKVHVVHVNYHKRAEDSDLDQQFVEATCTSKNVECSVFNFSPSTVSSSNFQVAARDFRFQQFELISEKYDDSAIVLAHHSDDQIETFLMNLVRGAGILGLASMPTVRNSIVRPFLNTSKSELFDYAKLNGITWREDSSNSESNYTRNKWRNEFIPLMEKEIPTIKSSILMLIDCFQEKQIELFKKINPIVLEIQQTKTISCENFLQLSSEEKFELWRQLAQDAATFPFFEKLPSKQKGKHIEMKGEFIQVIRESQSLYFVTINEEFNLPQWFIEKVDSIPSQFSKNELYLDSKKISGDLLLRPWKIGDRIAPIGMKGNQLVSNIIKDAKIPTQAKQRVLVLADAQQIHWVVGLKIGRQAIATSAPNILKIVVLKSETHKS